MEKKEGQDPNALRNYAAIYHSGIIIIIINVVFV